MASYKVCAEHKIIVWTWVEADSEEEAKEKAVAQIYNEDYETKEPVDDPEIAWAEVDE
ncbi:MULTISPECIES: hypothetical protein [unclassified Neptuniibacter]|uniref:hypothetical protein n=1 Tax=unclassified Neptuniibacter TaxID=2630693 RepID=UPI0025FC101D|nr:MULTISPECIES: hypothetical protein [unclassified Neptuniibacter]|tara:strand:- start:4751 stop:4924 length:174 start_codon:yes stop_codon:yes gene_type:complete